MAELAISALGPLAVSLDGERVERFEYNKVRALLVYLAVEFRDAHSRSALSDLLWPELPERAARGNLSQALATLRRALGEKGALEPFLVADADTVRLNPRRPIQVDVERFLDLVRASNGHDHRSWRTCSPCATRLRQAMDLYRGDFLGDFFLADSAPFEEWAALQREELRQRALGALEHLAGWAEWRGDFADAAECARRQVAIEPWLETGHRELMRLLALNGEPAAAMAHYEAWRLTLAAEFQTAPEGETAALYDRLRHGEVSTLRRATSPPFNGPAAPTPLIGRTADLAAVCERLRAGNVRALTLTGPGGIGKTRLALQVASELRYDFEDGVHMVELAALDDPTLVPVAVAHSLGVKDQAREPLIATLTAHLRDKHLLLILDNFEHLLPNGAHDGAAVGFAAELLSACPGVEELVTSRSPLRIRAEHLHELAPLAETEAAQLFVTRLQAVRQGYVPSDEDAEPIAEVCRRLDGLPLAIELIAARGRDLSPGQLLGSLAQGLDALAAGPWDVPARQRTLRGAIAWSYDRLGALERHTFADLGVFAGSGRLEAAQAVADQPAETAVALEALAAARLISLLAEPDGTRFALLRTIREFAQEELDARDDAARVRRRFADHYLAVAEQAGEAIRGPDQARWLDRLERDHDNFRATLEVQLAAGDEAALRLAIVLARLWEVRGYLSEGRRWLAAALDRCAAAPPDLRGKALHEAGLLAWRQGDYAQAEVLDEEGLVIWQALGDGPRIARSLRGLGALADVRGDTSGARSYYGQSLEIAREHDDPAGVAAALNNLGLMAYYDGDYETARAHFEECLPMMRALDDPTHTGNVLLNLGLVADKLGDPAAARGWLADSVAAFRAVGHKPGVALVLFNMGNQALALGDLGTAEAEYAESLAIHRALDDRADASYALFGLGDVAQRRGDLAAARALMNESLTLRYQTGEWRPIPRNLEGIASLDHAEGHLDRAARLLGAAAALTEALGTPTHPHRHAQTEQEIGLLRAELGDTAFAAAWSEGRALTAEETLALALSPH